jgi:hypothetical protein
MAPSRRRAIIHAQARCGAPAASGLRHGREFSGTCYTGVVRTSARFSTASRSALACIGQGRGTDRRTE